MIELLIEIKDAVELAHSQSQTQLDPVLHSKFLKRYDAITTLAREYIRGSPARKTTQLSPQSLLNRFTKSKTEILRFMFDFSVPFDNNGSERDLRMLKLQQKISGCFRTFEGIRIFCRVRSYLSSARKQRRSVLAAIEYALKGRPIILTS